jgi:anion-transporting  ArsA/GET3 family ATPase
MRLLLISGDDPLARRRLALAQVGPEDDVLDASGEELLTEAGRFDLLAALDHRWQALLPGLGPWLDLMEFPRAADRLPLLPGLEEVLLALELNDRICRCQARRLVVLLPATTAARRLLSGLSSAPELLERLYDPLLRRLGGLRQTIAGLESLLDLRLPAADGLRLPAELRQQLEDLERRLEDPERCELQLVQASDLAGDPLLEQRIAGFHLAGVQLSRLWLQGPLDPRLEASWAERLAPCLVHVGGEHGLTDWLKRPWDGEAMRLVRQEGDETVLALLLPGLSKERLQLRRIGRHLQLQVGSQRRLLALPAGLQPLQPCGARVDGRRLEVRFR